MAKIFGQIDSGELAARLGSINTFDRRGNVLWMDDFEGASLNWQSTTLGVGAGVTLSTAYKLTGSQSCKLTTANTVNATADIYRYLSFPVLSKIGWEMAFTSDVDFDYLTWTMNLFSGTYWSTANIKYDNSEKKIYYGDSGGEWQDIAVVEELDDGPHLFNIIKLVADFNLRYYTRLILNDVEYPLSSYVMRHVESDIRPRLYIDYTIRTGVAANTSSYVDNVIITQNEL